MEGLESLGLKVKSLEGYFEKDFFFFKKSGSSHHYENF